MNISANQFNAQQQQQQEYVQKPGSKKRVMPSSLYSLGQKNPGSGHKSDGDFNQGFGNTSVFNDAKDHQIEDEDFDDAEQN